MNPSKQLPNNLPVPEDDGACDHLPGLALPDLPLTSTGGVPIGLDVQPTRWTVVYCYPMTGRPDRELPAGWNELPGARGCTPQSCAFRDHHAELKALDATVFGLSTQTSAYQQEAKARLNLPFDLLSDHELNFAAALRLPTFDVDDLRGVQGVSPTLIKRLTLIARNGVIEYVFYPVFPPDSDAAQVLNYLESRAQG